MRKMSLSPWKVLLFFFIHRTFSGGLEIPPNLNPSKIIGAVMKEDTENVLLDLLKEHLDHILMLGINKDFEELKKMNNKLFKNFLSLK